MGSVSRGPERINSRGSGERKGALTQKAEHRVSVKHNWREKGTTLSYHSDNDDTGKTTKTSSWRTDTVPDQAAAFRPHDGPAASAPYISKWLAPEHSRLAEELHSPIRVPVDRKEKDPCLTSPKSPPSERKSHFQSHCPST